MILKKFNTTLFYGFVFQILLMVIIVIFNLGQIEQINHHLKTIVKQSNVKATLAYRMHDAARDRFIIINDMINSDDPFEREALLEKFYFLGDEFLKARNSLYDTGLNQEELETIDATVEISKMASDSHHKIINLIGQHGILNLEIKTKIRSLLQQEVFNSQNIVREATQAIVNLQRETVNNSMITAEKSFELTYRLMRFLGVIVILGSIFIAWRVIVNSFKNQEVILKSAQNSEDSNKSKSELLAIVAHELRTPLTSLIGYNELMSKTKLSNNQETISNLSISAGKILLHLINDVLDFSKIEENKMELEFNSFRLDDTCFNVFSLMQDIADRKDLDIECYCDKSITTGVIGDQLRLQQIMTNLISNAIKFTDNGTIQLLANKVSEDETKIGIQFEIKDSGIGMAIETVSRLFKPFEQADNSISRRFGGTGLGLTVSRRLVDKMGGKLVAYSNINEGSTFSFILVFDKCSYKYIEDNSQKISDDFLIPHLSGRVLIAEDTPDLQILIKFLVGSTGASTTIVSNGQDAIDHILKEKYDLILMDMRMPVMNGIDATQYLRNAGYKIPIVALTANSTGEYRELMIDAGCTDILNKPINQKSLYATLSTFLIKSDIDHEETNHTLAEEMLEIFIAELVKNIDIIAEAIESHDMAILKKTFHKIKGNAGSFGFIEISGLAARAEFKIESNDIDALKLCLSELLKYKAALLSGDIMIGAGFWGT